MRVRVQAGNRALQSQPPCFEGGIRELEAQGGGQGSWCWLPESCLEEAMEQ